MATLPPLIAALHDPHRFDHAVERVELVETHISWVLLTGRYAYKIKKPVDLGFLDFSTLARRRACCEEELRLNRRLTPELYLDVVAITGTPEDPRLGGSGEPIEYAVKMRQFPREAELDRLAARGALRPEHIDDLAGRLADFHTRIAVTAPSSDFGTPERVWEPIAENFAQIAARTGAEERAQLERLGTWSRETFARLRPLIAERRREGYVRECHGDAHLANMVLLNERVALFDCLEFNPALRWIDVISELAFLVMDLEDRGHPALARRALNRYLEHTGDYGGLRLLRFYQVYRALVRAKVAAIRLGQPGLGADEAQATRSQFREYLALAGRYTRRQPTPLVITHGLSGVGKTHVTQMLLEGVDAVRVRSDIERKRLHGLGAQERSDSTVADGIYTREASERTYRRLAEVAATILEAGFAAIVDATFLERRQRDALRALAESRETPFVILALRAPPETLRARIAERSDRGRDASEATGEVLDRQLAHLEPLGTDELPVVFALDTTDNAGLEGGIRRFLGRWRGV